MVRINRTYSIEEDSVEKLKKEDNASELINVLLLAHFNKSSSKDLKLLRKKVDGIENSLDSLRRERDRIADDIRDIEAQSQTNEQYRLDEIERKKKEKELKKWLSSKVKDGTITFDDYRNISNLENWDDCIGAVMSGTLGISELVEKAQHLNTTTTTN